MLALEVDRQLQPSPRRTAEIYHDLAAIRQTHPEVSGITYFPTYAPDELIVGFTVEAMEQFQQGAYHEWDVLNETYGVTDIEVPVYPDAYPYVILKFNGIYNIPALAEIYTPANLTGIGYVEQNGYMGVGSHNTIAAAPPFYTFIEYWEDDRYTGISRQRSWTFRTDDPQLPLASTSGVLTIDKSNISQRDKANRDSFRLLGRFDATAAQFRQAHSFFFQLGPYTETIALTDVKFNDKKFVYRGHQGGITSLILDFKKQKFVVTVKKTDLGDLDPAQPVIVGISFGAYSAYGQINVFEPSLMP